VTCVSFFVTTRCRFASESSNLRSRLNGFDVLTRASEISPATKVIMVTGANDFESVEKAMMLGAVDYVTKPFTVEYLEETVDSKIAAHLMYA
jgi:YesN/AraC family two-component response regulator